MKAEFYHRSNLQHAQKRRDIRRSITNPKTGSFTSCGYFICCAYLLEQAHTLHPSVKISPSQLCQLWNQEENLKWEENTSLYLHCCTATRSELAALSSCCTRKVHQIPSVSESTLITADQDFFSWTFMENAGFRMIVHAFNISSLLPSLLHLPYPIPPAVTHICQCTCTAVLESFLSAHLNGLTGLRTKDFLILLKESTSQQKQFFSWQFIHQHIAVIQGSHQSTGSFSDRSTVTFQNSSMHCCRGGGFRRENNSKHNLRNYFMLLNLWSNTRNVTYSVFSHKIDLFEAIKFLTLLHWKNIVFK